ncbi:ACP S-malonyltransferase [Cumulibacter manganitolerans]|uniref:ACP S-malonyltransferase n=1 Tax=Cumulibacter manganitolerans TaxID=1884992 RepID=UPI0012958D14|nr:ACP S-malonyltransferase [Cumulibacter manganitolerans]
MIAIVAPGQGSQTPGMFSPWLELPGARETVAAMSDLSGLDLERLGTTADADEIKDTAVTQPLVVSLALLAFEAIAPSGDLVVAGHSVGEIAAAAMAGVIPKDEAVRLAAVRGRAMADACALEETSMAAVLGGDEQEVLRALDALGLDPANRNGAGQIVAAGPLQAITALRENPPAKARVMPLSVAGAFHTRFMQPAQDRVAEQRATLQGSAPAYTLLSNADGTAVGDGGEFLDRLVTQVTSPVRWDLCMSTMLDLGVDAIVELPPAGALSGLARRAMKGVQNVAVKTPDDLDGVRDLLA